MRYCVRALVSVCFLAMVFLFFSCQIKEHRYNQLYPGYSREEPSLRVALLRNKKEVTIEIDGPFKIYNENDARVVGDGRYLKSSKIIADAKGFTIGGGHFNLDKVKIEAQAGVDIEINGVPYGGQIRIVRTEKGAITIVNIIGMEEYLSGVVPSEMPTHWPQEALKAQSVAARSYALYRSRTRSKQDYDVVSSINDQVYKGKLGANIRIGRIVRETRGLILSSNWQIFPAYFHSNSGGYTASAALVFGMSAPVCLAGQPSPYTVPNEWQYKLPVSKLRGALQRLGYKKVGKISKVQRGKKTASGRLKDLVIHHSHGSITVAATKIREQCGSTKIKSTLISEIVAVQKGYLFKGSGFGHGVGMCQYGAKEIAKKGHSFLDILEFYYPGSRFLRIY